TRRVPLNNYAKWALGRLVQRAHDMGSREPENVLLPGGASWDPTTAIKSFRVTFENCTRGSRRSRTCAEDSQRGAKPYFPSAAELWSKEHPHETNPFLRLRFHDMRHTFITWCGEAGIPLEKVMAMVGHLTVAMTRYYCHLNDRVTRQVVDTIG